MSVQVSRDLLLGLTVGAGLTLTGLMAGLAVRRFVLPRLARAASKTKSELDDILIASLRGPVVLWGVLIGLAAGTTTLALPASWNGILHTAVLSAALLSVTWVASQIAVGFVRHHAGRALGPLPSVELLSNLTRTTTLLLGGFILLETLGISVTPLLTALGVGGLAVGLALQDTLANVFAGIHILLARQIRPGDFVRLSSGEEGFVQDITWRYTTIRQLPNNLTIVPNSKLASSVTANFTLPDAEQAVLVEVGVAYDSDLERVERVTTEVGGDVMRTVEGGVPSFTPFIRYHTFGESSIQFTTILRGRDYVAQYLVKHEFIKRLHRRYDREGIEIPFPIRTIYQRTPGPSPS